MTSFEPNELRARFAALHRPGDPLVMPNPWDAGTAKALEAIGFRALATTSSGFAASLGRLDGSVSRDEALAHAGSIVSAVTVPVSADLENCFADDPAGVALTVRGALAVGLAGCSVEDYTGRTDDPIYDKSHAVDRVAAAAEAGHADSSAFVLTARAENHLHGRNDLADTIARLQAYQQAGADVLYAPGLTDLGEISQVTKSLDRPVNVLLMGGGPTVPELASAGVGRVSVGGSFAWVAYGALARAGRELLEQGSYGWMELAGEGRRVARQALGSG